MGIRASLNHVYRSIWNQSLGAMVAVAEIAPSQGGGGAPGSGHLQPLPAPQDIIARIGSLALSIALVWGVSVPLVRANPAGASAIVGSANLATQGNKLIVTTQNGAGLQHSAINWQSFSVPTGNTTHFQQPSAASTVINRVVTNAPSQLFGTLSSNGHLVLVNQAGIAVGPGALVDTSGFIASALRMTEADALAGRLRFGDATVSTAGISVQGRILARSGDAVLIAPNIDTGKDALIQAPNGSTLLAAGQQLEITGRGLEGISFQLQAPTDQALNLGTLSGNAVGIFAGTLKHSGQIRADAVTMDGGRVRLKAAGDAMVQGTGSIVARAKNATDQEVGGRIDVWGNRVGLTDQALLDASGAAGGGLVRVGGDYQGKNPEVPNATATYMGPEVRIAADAQQQGDGGRVIVWADDRTAAYGSISARGGEHGGNGGFVEVSGKQVLDFDAHVDTRAPKGTTGTLLLDPYNITVSSSGSSGLSSVNEFLDGCSGEACPNRSISASTINAATSNVELQAYENIYFDADIAIALSGVGLTARAGKHIEVNASIITTNGAILLSADDALAWQQADALSGRGGITLASGKTISSGGATITLQSNQRSEPVGGNNDYGTAIALAGSVNAGAGEVVLTANRGHIDQTAGSISAGRLTVLAGGTGRVPSTGGSSPPDANTYPGTISLTSSGNSFGRVSASANGTLSLRTSGTLQTVDTVSGTNVDITAGTGLQLDGGVTASGTLTLTATSGGINQTGGVISATGATSVTAGAAAAVSLGKSGNNFSTVSVSAAGSTVTLSDTTGLILGATSAGTLAVTVGGALTQSAALAVTGGTMVIAGGSVTLTNASNNFGAVAISATGQAVSVTDTNALDLGTISADSLTVEAGGSISQSGASSVSAASSFTATGNGDIALTNASNAFNTVSLTASSGYGGAVSVTDVNALTVSTLAKGTNKAVSLVAGAALSLPSGAIDTGSANLTLSSGTSLSTPGALSGANVALSGATGLTLAHNVTASGTLGLTSSAGALVQNSSTQIAAASTATLSANGITLNGNLSSSNASPLNVTLNAGSGTTVLGSGTVDLSGGTLTATGSGGNVSHASGTFTLNNANATLAGLTLTGGTLAGSGTMTVTGAFNVTGTNAILSGTGSLTTQGTSTVDMSANSVYLKLASGKLWLNQGTLNLGGDDYVWVSSGALTNTSTGTLNLSTTFNEPLYGAFSESGVVNNAGTLNYTLTGPTRRMVSTGIFNNSGTVNVQSGILGIYAGAGTDTGTYAISAGATLELMKSRTLAAGSSITGGGALKVSGGATMTLVGTLGLSGAGSSVEVEGILNANSDQTLGSGTTVTLENELGGPGTVTLQGAFNVTGGYGIPKLTGTGTLITQGASLISIPTYSDPLTVASGRTWLNQGTLTVADNDYISLSGTLTNAVGATMNLSSDAAIPMSGSGTLNNQGTLNHTSVGDHTIQSALNNSGILNVSVGTLVISGALSQNGTIDLASNAMFRKTGGFTNAGTLRGVGTFDVGAGNILTNNGTIRPGGDSTAGLLSITGDLVMGSSSTLAIDVLGAAVAGTDYDQLDVSGAASLGGTLSLTERGGFKTRFSHNLTPLTYASKSGTFTAVSTTANLDNAAFAATLGDTSTTMALASGTTNHTAVNSETGTTNWGVDANWDRGLPTALADAVIDVGGSNTVAVSSSAAAKSLTVSGGSTLTVGYGGNLSVAGSANIANLSMTDGLLSVTGGLTVSNSFTQSGGAVTAASLAVTQASGNLIQIAGLIQVSGDAALTSSGGAISLSGTGNDFNTISLTATGAVTLEDANAVVLGTTNSASLTVKASGNLTQSGAISVAGASSLTAIGGDITLVNAGNNFASVSVSASDSGGYGGAVSLVDTNALTVTSLTAGSNKPVSLSVGASGYGGTLTLPAAGLDLSGHLTVGASGYGGTVEAPGAVAAGQFTLADGLWSQNATELPAFTASDFTIESGTFLRVKGGTGASGDPYQLTDVYGLQGVGSSGILNKSFELAGSIDASVTATWRSGSGFKPIGGQGTPFTGLMDGKGFTMSGLKVVGSATSGVFGTVGDVEIKNGEVKNLGLVNPVVSGSANVGALVGYNRGTISNSYATGITVTGTGNVGGLVGRNSGSINDSYATTGTTGKVSSPGWVYPPTLGLVSVELPPTVGGLVGRNEFGSTIERSYANVTVGNTGDAGGLVGSNAGSINDAYALGSVTSSGGYAGGLVGINEVGASIATSYGATVVTGPEERAGGLVGKNEEGTVTSSYWNITLNPEIPGGAGTGLTTTEMQDSTKWGDLAFGGESRKWRFRSGVNNNFPVLCASTGCGVVLVYVRPNDGNSVYGSVPVISYALVDSDGNAYSLTDAGVAGSASYAGVPTAASNAGSYTISYGSGLELTGAARDDYKLEAYGTPSNWTVDRKTVSLSGAKTYDRSTDLAGAVTISTGILGQTLGYSGAQAFSRNVGLGNYISTIVLADGEGGLAANYQLPTLSAETAPVVLSQRALVVSGITAASRVYDGSVAATVNVDAVSLGGKISGDEVLVSATGVFQSKNVGTAKTVVLTSNYSGADRDNYLISDQVSANADVTPKAVLGAFTAGSRVYDGTTGATISTRTISGAIPGDVVDVSGGTATFADKNAGLAKVVTATGLSLAGADAGNYSVNSSASTTADITPAQLTLAGVTALSRVYNATTVATVDTSAASLTGVIAGDAVSVSGAQATGAFSDKNVGQAKPVAITGLSLTGADQANYTLNTTAVTSNAAITPATLTVTGIQALNKVYDGTTTATLNTAQASFSGLFAGDVVSASGGTATFADKNAGLAKTVTATGLSLAGADAANYSVNTSTTTTADITPKAITAAISAQSRVYDGTTAATIATRTLTGTIAGDDVNGSGGTATFADKNAGLAKTVTATGLSLAGADAGNYSVNSTASTTADITPAQLTLAGVTARSRVYDATTVATVDTSAASLTGMIAGDAVSVSGAQATGTFSDKNVGQAKPVAITGLSLTGADQANYTLNTTAVTSNAAITPAPLTVTGIQALNKVYDGTTTATLNTAQASFSGLLAGDVVSANGGTATFADKNAGLAKVVTATGLTMAGADAGNYTVSAASLSTQADITRKPITAAFTANSRIYDGTATATIANRTLTGAIAGDDISASGGTATYADKNAGLAKTVTAAGLTLAGADAGNYTVSDANLTTRADIAPRPMSTWAGGATGVWSDPANWDALPDAANVLSVSIPAGVSVSYDAGSGATQLQSISSGGGLSINGGSLAVVGSLSLGEYSQTSGSLTGGGALTVSNSFSQIGGSIILGGTADLTQVSGNLVVGALSAASIRLTSVAGTISQSGVLVTAGLLSTQSAGATLLSDPGNQVAAFTANSGGNVTLTNTGALDLQGLIANQGSIAVNNTGSISTSGAVAAPNGAIALTANSPLTIGEAGLLALGDIKLTATDRTSAGNLTLNGNIVSTGGSVTMLAANDLVQNSAVSAALTVTGSAGLAGAAATIGFGASATSDAKSVSYLLNGLNMTAPPQLIKPVVVVSTPANLVISFLDVFEQALSEPVAVGAPAPVVKSSVSDGKPAAKVAAADAEATGEKTTELAQEKAKEKEKEKEKTEVVLGGNTCTPG